MKSIEYKTRRVLAAFGAILKIVALKLPLTRSVAATSPTRGEVKTQVPQSILWQVSCPHIQANYEDWF